MAAISYRVKDPAPDDRRKLLVCLTAHGQAVVEKAFKASSTGLQGAFASFSSAELKSLTELLRRFREAFTETPQ
jgi:DNA-binding MarR family transcriptional regulator